MVHGLLNRTSGSHTSRGLCAPSRIYELWRRDDNGNRFLVETFDTHRDALTKARHIETTGIKQLYWISAQQR